MNKMKRWNGIPPILAVALLIAGCDDSITDFGFSGNISGTIRDAAGNPVPGNSATTDFRVFVLGEGETQPLEIRVRGDGTYQNTHLYPQVYRTWIQGPAVTEATQSNPIQVDLTGAPVTRDFTVTPFLTIARPTVGQPSGTSVQVTYSITPTAAGGVQTGANRVIWASTATWPGPTTGNVADRTHTVTTNLPSNAGTVTVSNLRSGRTYYLRVGARAVGTTMWSYSDQVSVTIP
jgi:hypothetical protein